MAASSSFDLRSSSAALTLAKLETDAGDVPFIDRDTRGLFVGRSQRLHAGSTIGSYRSKLRGGRIQLYSGTVMLKEPSPVRSCVLEVELSSSLA